MKITDQGGTDYGDILWMELAQNCVQWLSFILSVLSLWALLPLFYSNF
jgi:hypothetical protein